MFKNYILYRIIFIQDGTCKGIQWLSEAALQVYDGDKQLNVMQNKERDERKHMIAPIYNYF